MDSNLTKLAGIIKRDVGIDIEDIKGAGAAGGLGGGLLAFFDTTLKSGIDIVLDYLDFENTIKGADLVITGEGCFDHQTVMNKAPIGVARIAKKHGIKVIGISAVFGEMAEELLDNGFDAIFSVINQVINLDDAIAKTEENLYILSKSIASLL
jgi:glycerate kinase